MGAPRTLLPLPARRRKSTTLQDLFELDSKAEDDNVVVAVVSGPTLLPLPSVDPETIELVSNIARCNVVFTFTDPAESPSEVELKCQKLSRILSYVRSAKAPLDDVVLSPLAAMLSSNLFRALPPPAYPCLPSDLFEEDGPMLTLAPSWPHLQIVYDILSALIANAEPKALRRHFGHGFLLNLVSLFQSEDPRERERLKNTYHQLYSKLVADRSFMRKLMNNAFVHYVVDEERHYGIGDLLEISGSIINGFAVPLKEEHKLFLTKVLMPLHKPKGMGAYHKQLSYCIAQFVKKEHELCEAVVKGVLRHWPVTNCQKEVLLLGELEELVESLDTEEFVELALPVCSRIAKCSTSTNSQVAERALYVWNNEQFLKMASQCWEVVLPVTIEGIENNLRWHWSNSVRQLTASVKRMLGNMEPALYSKYEQQLYQRESAGSQEEAKRKLMWEKLEMAAALNS